MAIDNLLIERSASIRDALALLDTAKSGVLLLVRPDGRLDRTITDGDLRRLLLAGAGMDAGLSQLSEISSITLGPDHSRRDALALMQAHDVHHLPVVNAEGVVVDLLSRSGIDQQVLLSTPHMGESERDFVEQAFHTNWIAPLGPNVDAFERELADSIGVEHAVALSSGTAAIHLGLILLGVGRGDRVFCSSLTFSASVNPIVYQGAEPVLIDSEPDSWNMSPQALERAFEAAKSTNAMPKAVVVVSLYGQSADMDAIKAICDRHGVPILEDAAESLGASYKGKASGTFGDIGIYSFNGNKIITTSGGGMLVTADKDKADRARFLATQARDPAPHYQHSSIGYNYRLSNVLAGIGRGQLKVLGERVRSRRQVFDTYRTELAGIEWLNWMPEPEWSYSTRWLSVATIARDKALVPMDIIRRLSDDFIEARPVWKPMHLQPVFAGASYVPHGNASVSDGLFERGLCLPSGSNMTESQQARVIETILKLA